MREEQLEKIQKNGMRSAIFAQSTGMQAALVFRNSLLLLYLLELNVSQTRLMLYLSFIGIFNILRIPAAYYSDKIGKKTIGYTGNFMGAAGFGIIFLSGFGGSLLTREILAVAGIILFSLGDALFGSSWFPILRPIVPQKIRGAFFGKLRVTWQTAGLIFSGIAAFILGINKSAFTYQFIMFAVMLLLLARYIFYLRIPELEKNRNRQEKFFSLLGKVIRHDGYASFGAYIFLLMLFAYNTPNMFSLVEKETLELAPRSVVWLANITLAGSLAGYYLGGKAVDRLGSKPVFTVCHLSFALIITFFVLRSLCPFGVMPVLVISHFLFGIIYASSSIAITTETIALIPRENQALASSVLTTMMWLGTGCSSLLSSFILKLDCLKPFWPLGDMVMSNYDAIIILSGVMIFILTSALGLVPSIIRKKPA